MYYLRKIGSNSIIVKNHYYNENDPHDYAYYELSISFIKYIAFVPSLKMTANTHAIRISERSMLYYKYSLSNYFLKLFIIVLISIHYFTIYIQQKYQKIMYKIIEKLFCHFIAA